VIPLHLRIRMACQVVQYIIVQVSLWKMVLGMWAMAVKAGKPGVRCWHHDAHLGSLLQYHHINPIYWMQVI